MKDLRVYQLIITFSIHFSKTLHLIVTKSTYVVNVFFEVGEVKVNLVPSTSNVFTLKAHHHVFLTSAPS
ncbi:hypothetical protein HOG21_01560 [bacterium]|nr:hypothetical protein [bacterium]